MSTYAIIGATGNTGKPIALGLLEKGHTVRVVSRDAEKAKTLTEKGAKLFLGEITQPDLLKEVFNGSDAAYVMIPAAYQAEDFTQTQLSHVNAIATGLKGSSVKHLVTLSSIGAHLPSGAGVVQGLQKMEETLNTIPEIHILHLRATYFLENGLSMVGMVKQMGIMGSPVQPDIKIPMVATKDVAAVALKHLLSLDFKGKGHEYVLGSRDYTYSEIAGIYGRTLGKPELNYVQFPYADAKTAMMGMGMSESVTDRMMEFVRSLNDGKIQPERRLILRQPQRRNFHRCSKRCTKTVKA